MVFCGFLAGLIDVFIMFFIDQQDTLTSNQALAMGFGSYSYM